ncbi:MAG TPA: ATP-binding cassette domain-containing protein [Deinococcales bacterium]|nr:ATP-binding cassette domain-containing protein [Deinococcales bacterium]
MRLPAAGQTETPAPIPDAAIELENVSVDFENRHVLRGVNLSVRKGEILAVLGPSGCGKSTLLRVIAGLLRHTGRLRVTGVPAMVFQDYRLMPWRTARGNVALPRDLTGRGDDPDETLKTVGMSAFADLYPHQLSGGMRGRVALARALAQHSEVLLMDEPFAALDALVRERFNEELVRLHRKTGKTIVFVTHSVREAVFIADRVLVLREGRVQAIVDTRGQGRLSSLTEGVESSLRGLLGQADSTYVAPPPEPLRPPWELFGTLAMLAVALGGWTFLASRSSPLILPSPLAVAQEIVNSASFLWSAALSTLRVTLDGLLVSLLVGLPVGYLMGKVRTLERLFSPLVVTLQAIPTIIVAPLLIVWLGYGLVPRVAVTALVGLFPVLVSTMVGVREVDRTYRELFNSMRASWWRTLVHLEVPGALPVILGGLRLTVSLALIGTVVGEFVFLEWPTGEGRPGLGFLAQSGRLNLNLPSAYAAVVLNVVLGGLLYLMVTLLERWALRYRRR